jgi:multidrug efflux system membrane fusion protein
MRYAFVLRGLSALIATIVSVGGCAKSGGAGQASAPPEVSVSQVLVKRVKDWDEFTGRLQAVESVEIRPRVSGYLDKVAFTEGTIVKQGALLFVIDPRPYKADCDRAAAEVKRNKSALVLARVELERVKHLKESGAVSAEPRADWPRQRGGLPACGHGRLCR